MKEYLYEKEDFEILKRLKSETPIKIWWEMIQYVFEYENYYISLEIQALEKKPFTSNHPENVVTPKFKVINKKYKPSEIAVVIAENMSITGSYIVRTILYFETSSVVTSKEKKGFLKIFQQFGRKNKKYFESMLNSAMSYSINVQHPDIPFIAEAVEPYVVDVGYVFLLDDKIMECFLEENSDDFDDYDETYIVDYYNFETKFESYKFINID